MAGDDATTETVPICRCGEPLRRDRMGLAVNPQIPGWACIHCAGVFDLTKMTRLARGFSAG